MSMLKRWRCTTRHYTTVARILGLFAFVGVSVSATIFGLAFVKDGIVLAAFLCLSTITAAVFLLDVEYWVSGKILSQIAKKRLSLRFADDPDYPPCFSNSKNCPYDRIPGLWSSCKAGKYGERPCAEGWYVCFREGIWYPPGKSPEIAVAAAVEMMENETSVVNGGNKPT